jgi:hypothetical protein
MRLNRVAIAAIALFLGSSGALVAQRGRAGATAKCADGTYSKAKAKQGACSAHKGIAQWYGTGDHAVPRPAERAPTAPERSAAPAGTTARCSDGTYSTAKTHAGACSKHGGVAEWREDAPVPAPAPRAETRGQPVESPQGATARCNDGTYSHSQHRSGTCSHHGGVKQWLKNMPN